MTHFFTIIFWISFFIILYTYLLYFSLALILSRILRKTVIKRDSVPLYPEVTLVIAAYNEEQFIAEKIENTLALDYPVDQLKVLVVTDGSTDATPGEVKKFPQVALFHEAERRGKIHAVDRIMKHITSPIVIFTDANTLLNKEAVKNIVRHYQDEQVGGVAGEKRVQSASSDNASGAGEGLYWKYESLLKQADSDLYTVVGAAGELFSIRTSLYESPPPDTIIEDFVLSMKIVSKGYRFIYEPQAFALEGPSASVEDEWKRKVRISAGGLQAIARLKGLLNPFRYGIVTFQYVSHRVFRWTIAPLALVFVFFANYLLIGTSVLYTITFLLQLAFYGLAAAGHLLRNKKIPLKGFFVPYYFMMMNLSVFSGLIRLIRGKQTVIWEKAKRA